MTKKIVSWLAGMAVFAFTLQSCMNEDLYSSAEKQKQQIVSRSLWKEDILFIKRIYDHFEKSFMPSGEEKNRFTLQYGTPSWEYAMTMGFGKSQLYVPLITGDRVTGMMQVLRQDKKAVYAFTQDPEALDFFETIIYNPRHARLEPRRDQKLGMQNTAKGSYTWTCSKRIVTTGWHMEGDTMVMQSSLVEVCKYTYTGMNPAVDHLEVDTDGMESGGGDDEGEEYEGSPCQKMKNQISNAAYKAKIEALDKPSVLSLKKETGFAESKSGIFTDLPQAASNANSDGMTVTVTPSLKGYIHTHLNDYFTGNENENGEQEIKKPIRMFSPADVNTLMTMAGMATDDDYSELYGTMVSRYGYYTIMFTGTAADIKIGFDTEQWRTEYVKYRKDHELWTFEKLFLNFLKNKMNVQGVELYKIKDNGTVQKKTLNSNNNIQSSDCP